MEHSRVTKMFKLYTVTFEAKTAKLFKTNS